MSRIAWKQFVLLVLASCAIGCQLPPNTSQKSRSPVLLMKQTGETVRDALRIESRVVKAQDPTNLDYDAGPIKPSLHLKAASVLAQSGQYDEARRHYERALADDPGNRTALIGIARLHHRSGSLDKAIDAYQHAHRIIGDDPLVLNDLALCLARSKRYDQAIANLRTAVSMKPDSLMYRNNLVAVLVQAQRADEAVAVLAGSHGLAIAHYNVGYLLNQDGKSAAASAHFVRSLKANPSFAPAQSMLDRVIPQVGRPLDRSRIAKWPDPAASASVSASTATNVEPSIPAKQVEPLIVQAQPVVPAVTMPSPRIETAMAESDPPSQVIQPVAYIESIEADRADVVDTTPVPAIRLPSTAAWGLKPSVPGVFVAPLPAGR